MSDGYVDKPRPLNEAFSSRLLTAIVAVMVAVFVGDLLVPLGIAGGVLYVVAVLLALWFLPHYVFGFAAACTVLTVVGYFASLEGGDIFVDFANRVVAVLAIWVVAVLGLHRRKLSETVHRHGQIIDQVQDAVITVDMSGVIDYWNKGAESVFGYSAHDIVGQSARKLYASGDAEVIRQDVLDRLIAEGSAELETEGVRQNGEVIVIRQWVLLRRDESYEPAGVIFQVSDVTRRREVEKAATRMETFYQNVLDELPLQVAIFDTEGRFLYLNPASLSIPERRAWIIGRTEREYFEHVGRNVELADERDSYRRQAMAERTKVTYEELFETQSGERRSYAHGFFPVVGVDGEIDKVLGFRYDITDHKRTAWALQESLARLKAIVDTAADGILTIDGDGIVESCNQAAQRLFGFEPAEAIGRHIETLIAGVNGEAVGGLYEGHLTRIVSTSTPEMAEFVALKKDGTTFPVEVATSKLRLDDQPLFTAIVRDLTNRKRAERALLRYNERLEAFRQMDQAILTASSTKAVAQVAVDHLARLIPAGMVCIALFDKSEDIASVLTVQCEGLSSRESTASIREFLGASEESEVQECISRACIQGHVTMVPDVSADGRDLASVVAIPLAVQDSVIGMLKLEARSGAHFGSEDIDIAKEVAGVLAIAINDARLFEEVVASRERLKALSHRLVEVQEQERRLIARELHDEIGQALTGLKFSLENLEAHSGPQNVEQIEESRRITLQLLARVRDLSLDLRPAMLDDLGLLPALLWLADRYSSQTGVEVSFRHSGLDERLDPEIETAAYRIVQETLTNVARHAGRAQVEILLIVSAETLVVRVKDDGAGFDLKKALDLKNSTGLSGMYERASLLGGTLTVDTEPGKGTTVSAEFPLVSDESMELTS